MQPPALATFVPNVHAIVTNAMTRTTFYIVGLHIVWIMHRLWKLAAESADPKRFLLPKFITWTLLASSVAYFSNGAGHLGAVHAVLPQDALTFSSGGLVYTTAKVYLWSELLTRANVQRLSVHLALFLTAGAFPVLNYVFACVLPTAKVHVRDPDNITTMAANAERAFRRSYVFSVPPWIVFNGLLYLFIAHEELIHPPVHPGRLSMLALIMYCYSLLPLCHIRAASPMELFVAFLLIHGIFHFCNVSSLSGFVDCLFTTVGLFR